MKEEEIKGKRKKSVEASLYMMSDEKTRRDTAKTKARYDRIAPIYNGMESIFENTAFKPWRDGLWSRLPRGRVLEVGVGTGKNMFYYPDDVQVTAIDLSGRMLEQSKAREQAQEIDVNLAQMDAQQLGFPDDIFDALVASFVFCSVPDPVVGLQELGRVTRPRGDIWLLEHVRINRPLIGTVMDILNPLVVPVMGANINRRTVENVEKAGLELIVVKNLMGELVKLIHARAT